MFLIRRIPRSRFLHRIYADKLPSSQRCFPLPPLPCIEIPALFSWVTELRGIIRINIILFHSNHFVIKQDNNRGETDQLCCHGKIVGPNSIRQQSKRKQIFYIAPTQCLQSLKNTGWLGVSCECVHFLVINGKGFPLLLLYFLKDLSVSRAVSTFLPLQVGAWPRSWALQV